MAAASIRRYRPTDLDDLYLICHLTGWAGKDATGIVADEHLLGDVYAAPYAVIEPGCAFVLDDGTGTAVGYVLGAPHTRAFEAACEERWWPLVRARRPRRPGSNELDDLFIDVIHDPPAAADEVVERYPSHLHIDLLPSHQGQGWGRRLLDTLTDELRARGSHGVHLDVSVENPGAIAFYEHVGFELFADNSATRTYVRSLS